MPRNTRFFVNSIKKMVAEHGDPLLWTFGIPCPCSTDRLNAVETCQICGGTGIFWDDSKRKLISAMVLAPSLTRHLAAIGVVEEGDLLISQTLTYPHLSPKDRIELMTTDGEAYEGETRPRIGNTTILSYQPVIVERITTGDPETGIVTHYSCVERERCHDDLVLASYDSYFQRAESDGRRARYITWNTGKGPPEGTRVSVAYSAYYEYIVWDQPKRYFDRDNDLGPFVRLRLKHRFFNTIRDTLGGPETPTPSDPALSRRGWE